MSPRPTVLLVEDDPDLLRFAQVTLRLGGYRPVTASDGVQALTLARKRPPDLVLLDLRLPGLDGWEVLAALRDEPALRTVPVVLLTATINAVAAERALDARVADYLVKPVSADDLLDAVERALARRNTGAERMG